MLVQPTFDTVAFFKKVDSAIIRSKIVDAINKMSMLVEAVNESYSTFQFDYSYHNPGKANLLCKTYVAPDQYLNKFDSLTDRGKCFNKLIQDYVLSDSINMFDTIRMLYYTDDPSIPRNRLSIVGAYIVNPTSNAYKHYENWGIAERLVLFGAAINREVNYSITGKGRDKHLYILVTHPAIWFEKSNANALVDRTKNYARIVYDYVLRGMQNQYSDITFVHLLPNAKRKRTYDLSDIHSISTIPTSDTLFTNISKMDVFNKYNRAKKSFYSPDSIEVRDLNF